MAAFLAAGFFAAFFFAAITSYLLRLVIPVSSQGLIDEVFVTSAVVRNAPLTRVGSVASVEAITSSIAIQVVLIHRLHPPRQEIVKIFFRAMPGEVFGMRNIHDVSRPFEGPSTHRVREMRKSVVRRLHRSHRGENFA